MKFGKGKKEDKVEDTKVPQEVSKAKVSKEKKKEKKEKKKRQKIEGGQITWGDVKLFFKGIWLFIKAVLKFILAPFWYTGLLFLLLLKFLKNRGDYALTEKEKETLSLIPTFYLMLSINVTIIFVLFSRQLISAFWSKLFSPEVGSGLAWFFIELGKGLAWFFTQIYYGLKWIWDGLVALFNGHPFPAIMLIIVALILLAGLTFFIYYAPFTQKAIAAIRRFFNNIRDLPDRIKGFFVNLHNKWKSFTLNKLIGKKYLESKSKSFFWIIVFFELIISGLIVVIALIQGITRLLGEWELADTLKFFAYVTGLLFIFVGIFATWFFVQILGLATKKTDRFSVAEVKVEK